MKKQNTLKVIQRGFIRKRGSWWECKEKDKTTTKFPSRICNEQVRRLSCSVSPQNQTNDTGGAPVLFKIIAHILCDNNTQILLPLH